MSGNAAPAAVAKPVKADPRVRRTRDTLGDALVELMQQMPFDDITVQQLLDRAGVGRTTFYSHYRDMQDLFLSDVEEFLEAMSTLLSRRNAPRIRIAPMKELLTHLCEVRGFHDALISSGKMADVRELGLGYFTRSITERLRQAGVTLSEPELQATAHMLAGAMFSLIELSMTRGSSAAEISPEEIDALFHRLAWQGIGSST